MKNVIFEKDILPHIPEEHTKRKEFLQSWKDKIKERKKAHVNKRTKISCDQLLNKIQKWEKSHPSSL